MCVGDGGGALEVVHIRLGCVMREIRSLDGERLDF